MAWQPVLVPMTLRFEIFPADLDATAQFYTSVLGFALVTDDRNASEPYLYLQRDGVRIGAVERARFDRSEQRRPPVGVEIVLEVDDVGAEHGRVVGSSWPIAEDLQDHPWGLRDFRLLDPDGYYLRITSRRSH